jgi:hypothetical protein
MTGNMTILTCFKITYSRTIVQAILYYILFYYFTIYNKGLLCNYIVDLETLQFSRLIHVPEDGSGEPKHVVQNLV